MYGLTRNTVVLKCVRQGPHDTKPLPVVIYLQSHEKSTLHRYRAAILDPLGSTKRLRMKSYFSMHNHKHHMAVHSRPLETCPASSGFKTSTLFVTIPFFLITCGYWMILARTKNYTAVRSARQWVILTCV